jgi:hypothetical protein
MAADLCVVCKTRPATINWVASGSSMDFIHGLSERRCMICCLRTQLEKAMETTAQIPRLQKELENETRKWQETQNK